MKYLIKTIFIFILFINPLNAQKFYEIQFNHIIGFNDTIDRKIIFKLSEDGKDCIIQIIRENDYIVIIGKIKINNGLLMKVKYYNSFLYFKKDEEEITELMWQSKRKSSDYLLFLKKQKNL